MHNPATEDKVVDSKAFIVDSLSKILEIMLSNDICLNKMMKLEIVHLLTKLKANKKYLGLVKANQKHQPEAFSNVYQTSELMFQKATSAFESD